MEILPEKSRSYVIDDRVLLERKGMTKAVDMLDRFQDSLRSHAALPKCHRRNLRTTNMLERINQELKSRTGKVGAFPGEQSLLRLTVSILMDVNEGWVTGARRG